MSTKVEPGKANKTDAEKPEDDAKAAGVDEVESEETKEADDEATGPRARRRVPTRGTLLRAAAALVLIAAVVTAGLQWYRVDQAAQEDAARQAVKARAGEFGRALLSYDHRDLDKARERVMSLASDDFAKTYDVAFTGGLEGVITKLEADATATVQAVYLGEIDESTARAIVVMDSKVHSSAGTRRVLGSHLDMRLIRKDGEWRITEVTSIGAARETMTDPKKDGGATAPAPEASPSE